MALKLPTENVGTRGDGAVLSVTLARAPYDRVMPAAIGLFRAQFGFSRVKENPARGQYEMLQALNSSRTYPNELYAHSNLVSAPRDAPDVPLIEDWFGLPIDALAHLLPDVTFLSIYSLYESKTCARFFKQRND